VTIPMKLGTDSLNVSVAAGVVLYHFTQYAG
jgi:tRNA G18 (ribose-2'-O)-methylase SpoU